MALPTILIDSATGSDTAASGAGPSTALTGTSASTDGAGTLVTLDGSPVLTNVATDGSHVIYLADTTAGARNFGKITAKDNAAKTVTVANAFGVSLSGKSWAIGGRRASLSSSTTAKLVENNSGNGDALPGWVLELCFAHSETFSYGGTFMTFRRAGDTTTGAITLRGASGAATRPLLTCSNNATCLYATANGWIFKDFEIRNSNATKTNSVGIFIESAARVIVNNVKIGHATNYPAYGIVCNGTMEVVDSCDIGYCAVSGIETRSGSSGRFLNNYIHHGAAAGMTLTGTNGPHIIFGNVVAYNGGIGINITGTTTLAQIINNTIHGNTSDGIKFNSASGSNFVNMAFDNNAITFNGGYGINFSGASVSDATFTGNEVTFRNNCFYSNTTDKFNPNTLTVSVSEIASDPSGGLASATKDYAGTTNGAVFSVGTALKAVGYPLVTVGNVSGGTQSYVDIGAAQRQESGGGVRQVNVNGGADQ